MITNNNDTINTIKTGTIDSICLTILANNIDLSEMDYYSDIDISYSEKIVKKNGNEYTYYILHESSLEEEIRENMWFMKNNLLDKLIKDIMEELYNRVWIGDWKQIDPIIIECDADKYRMETESEQ